MNYAECKVADSEWCRLCRFVWLLSYLLLYGLRKQKQKIKQNKTKQIFSCDNRKKYRVIQVFFVCCLLIVFDTSYISIDTFLWNCNFLDKNCHKNDN